MMIAGFVQLITLVAVAVAKAVLAIVGLLAAAAAAIGVAAALVASRLAGSALRHAARPHPAPGAGRSGHSGRYDASGPSGFPSGSSGAECVP